MQLALMTSWEVQDYLERSRGIILPVGSMEQHGPIGMIGTDAICAEHIARRAGSLVNALVAPTLHYTPAQFNNEFSGTVSISSKIFAQYIESILRALGSQGFERIYILNAHGANLAPIQVAMHDVYDELGEIAPLIRIRSWWEFDQVNALRDTYYGDREGLHGTPSEIAITQSIYPDLVKQSGKQKPDIKPLDAKKIHNHAGDRHGPSLWHKQQFPSGLVGSDPFLAQREAGDALIRAAARSTADDYSEFVLTPPESY